MENSIQELKEHLIEELNLEEITPEEIDAEAPLFGDGLCLDSIDALEVILILEKYYGVKWLTRPRRSLCSTQLRPLQNT